MSFILDENNKLLVHDKEDFREESNRYSDAVSARPSIWHMENPNSFERWFRSITVEESIRFGTDPAIRRCVDEHGNFIYPWRTNDQVS